MSDWFVDHLAVIMFLVLTFIMFVGYPVAFVLGATGVFFALLGIYAGVFKPAQFASLLPRIYAQAVENQALVAIPMFIFMGTMLEKSKVAEQLLYALQVLLRRVPGGLAISVTLLGTIMAATTGIVGASVVMLTLIALPVMMQRGYNKELAVGTIASAGTLGILIPPSIMLVIMGDLMTVPVGTLFAGAIIPGLVMSSLYVVYIITLCFLKPALAPPLGAEEGPQNRAELIKLVTWSFAPAAFLITLVLGSIFAGWATPTEAAGVGCAGAMLLALLNRQFNMKILTSVLHEAATTNALVFFIIFGATLFSYVFRALGGDDVVAEILKAHGHRHGLGDADLRHGPGVLHGLLLRLDRDLPRRHSDLRAADRQVRLRHGRDRQGSDPAVVRHPDGRQHADRVPDAAIRLRAVLHEGDGAAVGDHGAHLPGHRAVRRHPAGGAGALHGLSDAGAAAAALLGIPGLSPST